MKDEVPQDIHVQDLMSHAIRAEPETSRSTVAADAETLFREHAQFVAAFLRHMGLWESDVDDALQDVFMVAHRRGGYQPLGATPRTWLASIAIRVVQARRRARRRHAPASPITESMAVEKNGPAEALDAKRSASRVLAALQAMTEEQRAAFVLYELEGESCESIAATWKVPLGTVYSRLHYARRLFLEAYNAADRRAGRAARGDR